VYEKKSVAAQVHLERIVFIISAAALHKDGAQMVCIERANALGERPAPGATAQRLSNHHHR